MEKNEMVRELADCALRVNQNLTWALTALPLVSDLRDVSVRLARVAEAAEKIEFDARVSAARVLVAQADGVAKTE